LAGPVKAALILVSGTGVQDAAGDDLAQPLQQMVVDIGQARLPDDLLGHRDGRHDVAKKIGIAAKRLD